MLSVHKIVLSYLNNSRREKISSSEEEWEIENIKDKKNNRQLAAMLRKEGNSYVLYLVYDNKKPDKTEPHIGLDVVKKELSEYADLMSKIVSVKQRDLDPDRIFELTKNLDDLRRKTHDKATLKIYNKAKQTLQPLPDDRALKTIINKAIHAAASDIFESEYSDAGMSNYSDEKAHKAYLIAAKMFSIDSSRYKSYNDFIKAIRKTIKEKGVDFFAHVHGGYKAIPGSALKIERALLEQGIPVVAVPHIERHGDYAVGDEDETVIRESATFYTVNHEYVDKLVDFLLDKGFMTTTLEARHKVYNLMWQGDRGKTSVIPESIKYDEEDQELTLSLDIDGILGKIHSKILTESPDLSKVEFINEKDVVGSIATRFSLNPKAVRDVLPVYFHQLLVMPVKGKNIILEKYLLG